MHPSYSALLLHILPFLYFIGLKHQNRILAAYFAVGMVPFMGRIMAEERGLEQHFGTESFAEYKAKRWRLIPFIW